MNVESSNRVRSRRAVLRKATAGVGVAGVAWSAPRVAGLSVRPDFAAAQSATTTTTTMAAPVGDTTVLYAINADGGRSEAVTVGGVPAGTLTANQSVFFPSFPTSPWCFEIDYTAPAGCAIVGLDFTPANANTFPTDAFDANQILPTSGFGACWLTTFNAPTNPAGTLGIHIQCT